MKTPSHYVMMMEWTQTRQDRENNFFLIQAVTPFASSFAGMYFVSSIEFNATLVLIDV